MPHTYAKPILILSIASLLGSFVSMLLPSPSARADHCPGIYEYIDPTYGNRVRQIVKEDGHEHNLYYYRSVFNTDNSYMVGIQENIDHTHWRVVLYTGDGCFIKTLFPISETWGKPAGRSPSAYKWQLAWDRNDPAILYTQKGNTVAIEALIKLDVNTLEETVLKEFPAPSMLSNIQGPSLNQAGDRIMVIVYDGAGVTYIQSYHLPDMTDERKFEITSVLPTGCATDQNDVRYIGYLNYMSINFASSTNCTPGGNAVVSDTGQVLHTFRGSGTHGHYDFSPNGKFAYRIPSKEEVHVVNIDGTDDRVVFNISPGHIQESHISWPDKVNDWFVLGVFPSGWQQGKYLPTTYATHLDELIQINVDGTVQYLTRTGTADIPGESFWSQPQPSVSADGSRISFNSTCFNDITQPLPGCKKSSRYTIDNFILYTTP